MAAQYLHEGETRAILLHKQDAKKQELRPRKKSSFFTKVTEYFSANFHILYRLLLRLFNFPMSH